MDCCFTARYYSDVCNIPTLNMKGYDILTNENKEPVDRSPVIQQLPRKPRNVYRSGIEFVDVPIQTPSSAHWLSG